MVRYAVRRALGVIPTFVAVFVVTFFLVHAGAGDRSAELAGEGATPERVAEIRHSLGLDQSMPRQFATYLGRLAHGDLGNSWSENKPVRDVITSQMAPTVLLTGTALFLSTVLGLALGLTSARRPHGTADGTISAGALLLHSVPSFWLAQIAVFIFAYRLHLFPLLGYTNARTPPTGFQRIVDITHHLILPALVLAASELALLTRVTRSGLLRELDQPYSVTAAAKGLPKGRVVDEHAMRNAMLPVVTVVGTRIGFLVSGAVVIETVFSWPGLGSVLRGAVTTGDAVMVQGVLLVVTAGVLLANLATDLVYGWIDPRARAS